MGVDARGSGHCSLYFQPEPALPNQMAVLAVNPLLREIIERMALWPWDKPRRSRLHTGIIEEELAQAPRESWQFAAAVEDGRPISGWLQRR